LLQQVAALKRFVLLLVLREAGIGLFGLRELLQRGRVGLVVV
jgi:hypothetical protein